MSKFLCQLFGTKYSSGCHATFFNGFSRINTYHCFSSGCLPLSQNTAEVKIWRQKEAFEAYISSDKFKAYLAETLPSLCLVMLFVMGKGIHECNTKRNSMYMLCNLSSLVHVTTATNTFCLEVAVQGECNHGFALLNCDFEKCTAAVRMRHNVLQC